MHKYTVYTLRKKETKTMAATLKKIPYRHRDAAKIAMVASAALGPAGAFSGGADILAVGGIWSACLVSIASKEGCSLDKNTALGICKSIAWGVSGYYVGCKVATNMFNFIPGAGTVAAIGASSLANVIFTYRFVLTLCRVFEKAGGSSGLELDRLADEVMTMYKGNGLISDLKDIVAIYSGK